MHLSSRISKRLSSDFNSLYMALYHPTISSLGFPSLPDVVSCLRNHEQLMVFDDAPHGSTNNGALHSLYSFARFVLARFPMLDFIHTKLVHRHFFNNQCTIFKTSHIILDAAALRNNPELYSCHHQYRFVDEIVGPAASRPPTSLPLLALDSDVVGSRRDMDT